MDLERGFRKWPLGRQMQVLFISSGLVICAVLIIITKVQIDWLKETTLNSSEKTIENRIIDQMRALAQIEAKFIASELMNLVYTNSILHSSDMNYNSFSESYESNPFAMDTAHSNTEYDTFTTNYLNGAYYSKYDLSEAGQNLVEIESCFNKLYPIMFLDQFRGFFQGYETDEILNFYPAKLIQSVYSPLSSDWYFKSANNTKNFCLSEPYAGSDYKSWVVYISKALQYNNTLYGVVALNASLEFAINKLSYTIIGAGMPLLIGKEGVVLNLPSQWDISSNMYVRIFDESITGISEKKWESIKEGGDGAEFSFTDKNNVTYKAVVSSVVPEPFLGLSYYVVMCVDEARIVKFAENANRNFSSINEKLFWVVFSIGLTVFIIEIILIFLISRKSSQQLCSIKKIFEKLLRSSLFPNKILHIDCDETSGGYEGFEALITACAKKLKNIENYESTKGIKTWKYSRPDDCFINYEWAETSYPFNYYFGKSMAWRKALTKLKVAKV